MDSLVSMDKTERLALFRKSEAGDLKAEVFLDELQFILGEEILDQVVVNHQGMNERILSKDIIEARIQHTPLSGEQIFLVLARNSIYHQLPEILFHPLSLSKANMSIRELVSEIKANRNRSIECIKFFSPFDTAFFKERVKIHQRHLSLFSKSNTNTSLRALIDTILSTELTLTEHQRYKLFLFLCQAEKYKEELPRIEVLIKEVMEVDVCLQYIPHIMTDFPFPSLGEAILGIDTGLSGTLEDELDDLQATLLYNEVIPETVIVSEHIKTLKTILHFFILSGRCIKVQYVLQGRVNFVLGGSRLGYDTHI